MAMLGTQDAESAIQNYDAATDRVTELSAALVKLQADRPAQKMGALVRLVQQPHPATVGKTYSISQAEDVLQLDADYAEYKARVAVAESELREALDRQRSALLVAELRIAETKAAAGVR